MLIWILYRDERTPKFRPHRVVLSQIISKRVYDALCMLLMIATVLFSNTLFGDKGRGVMVSKLQ